MTTATTTKKTIDHKLASAKRTVLIGGTFLAIAAVAYVHLAAIYVANMVTGNLDNAGSLLNIMGLLAPATIFTAGLVILSRNEFHELLAQKHAR